MTNLSAVLGLLSSHIPSFHFDPISLLVGAVGAPVIVHYSVKWVSAIPAAVVGRIKDRVRVLAAEGKISAPTLRLLVAIARAVFSWADAELPDHPGPAKMAAVLDRLAGVPYMGAAVRADRAGVQEILQAAYDAVKAEAHAESAGCVAPKV